MYYDNIAMVVARLKRRNDAISSPFALCHAMKILLNPMNYGTHENSIKGFANKIHNVKCITYNCDLPLREQEQIIWHEIGHCVLHKLGTLGYSDIGLFNISNSEEKEANLFSAEYQLDDQRALETLNKDLTFSEAASALCVPTEVLDFKLRMMRWKGYKISESPVYTQSTYLRNFNMGKSEDDF